MAQTQNQTQNQGKNAVTRTILSAKMKDLPKGLYLSLDIDDYGITIDLEDEVPEVLVITYNPKSEVTIGNPDPEATVDDIFQDAKALIEKYRKKVKVVRQ